MKRMREREREGENREGRQAEINFTAKRGKNFKIKQEVKRF